jgi:exosortase
MPIVPDIEKNVPTPPDHWRAELVRLWQRMPSRWGVLFLVGLWIAAFQLLGNSTLGYVNTPSLFGWAWWIYTRGAVAADGSINIGQVLEGDEAYAFFIPVVVVALLWCRRDEWLVLTQRVWWPALGLFGLAVGIHAVGYMVQQPRVSVVGFFLGIYAITGLFWGPGWLRLALFPFALFAFCVPLGSSADVVTVPLRLLATKLTAVVCQTLLGINVIQNGTQLFDAAGSYQYEVAPACSGIRSLTAILAFGVIYGYVTFQTTWRRLLAAAVAFPLAVVANVFRLTLIVLAAEAFGQDAGNYVHENSWFSLAPYVPSIGGMLLLGWWLREDRKDGKNDLPVLLTGVEQKS